MILTIILILSFLVAFNFILLFFSCNKIPKKIERIKSDVAIKEIPTEVPTQLPSHQLAATGS